MPRDLTIAWTEAELEEAKLAIQKIPSFSDGSIPSSDIRLLWEALDMERTPEQEIVFKSYWDASFGGRIPLDEFISVLSVMHVNAKLAYGRAQAYDKDGDGFISKDEFSELMGVVIAHDPKLKKVPYEDFVREADTNKDGKVSLQECGIWIERNIGNL